MDRTIYWIIDAVGLFALVYIITILTVTII